MTASRESRSAVIFERDTYAVGVHYEPLDLRSIERATIQWSAFATDPGATATIRFYLATVDESVVSDGTENPLVPRDPATNRNWALIVDTGTGVPIQFFDEPAGVPDSETLPIPSICATEMLVELTVIGASLTQFQISARVST